MIRHCILLAALVLVALATGARAQMIGTQFAKKLVLADASASFVPLTLKAPAALSGAYTLTFPDAPPEANGYLLSSSSTGVLSWVSPASGDFLSDVSHGSTLAGAGTSGSPLEMDLTNANAWSGVQSFPLTGSQGDALVASINAAGNTIDAATIGIGLTNAQVQDDLTVDGGTIDNSAIGATSPSSGRFTTITATALPSGSTSTDVVTSNGGALETRVATNTSIANTLVVRDASGNFSAQTITANLTGNVTGTATNVAGTVAVGHGGTGVTTLPSNGLLYGNGTSAVQATAASTTAGQFLTSATASAAPTWGSVPMLITGGVQALAQGNTGNTANPTVEYSAPMGWFSSTQATDAIGISRILIPKSGTVKNFYVMISASPAGVGVNANTRKFTLTKTSGGITTATTVTTTITSPNTSGNDLVHSFTVSAGDEISVQISTAKVGTTLVGAANADWGFILETP